MTKEERAGMFRDKLYEISGDREKMKKAILGPFEPVFSDEQYQKTSDFLDTLSDNELFNILFHSAMENIQNDWSLKDALNAQMKLKEMLGTTFENAATKRRKLKYLPDDLNEKYEKIILENFPSDKITLTAKQDNAIMGLWEGKEKKEPIVPSDLFFAGTIPLMDFELTIDERGYYENGQICRMRYIIFEDYKERIEKSDFDTFVDVGLALFGGEYEMYSPFFVLWVVKGVDALMFGNIGFINAPKEFKDKYVFEVGADEFQSGAFSVMSTWYGIQVALLHPVVADVFQHPTLDVVRDEAKKPHKKQKRSKVKYIKKHVIRDDELETAIYGPPSTDKKIRRHALVWYVIGHWRTYQDGRKVFISPYWKGPLRELKMSLEDREREIVIPELTGT